MLTRKQIEKLAVKNKVSLFTQERDYIQAVYLSILYSNTRSFIFKGGTCLRIVYHSARYSEDLDFNSDLDEKSAYKILETAALELKYFGITAKIKECQDQVLEGNNNENSMGNHWSRTFY